MKKASTSSGGGLLGRKSALLQRVKSQNRKNARRRKQKEAEAAAEIAALKVKDAELTARIIELRNDKGPEFHRIKAERAEVRRQVSQKEHELSAEAERDAIDSAMDEAKAKHKDEKMARRRALGSLASTLTSNRKDTEGRRFVQPPMHMDKPETFLIGRRVTPLGPSYPSDTAAAGARFNGKPKIPWLAPDAVSRTFGDSYRGTLGPTSRSALRSTSRSGSGVQSTRRPSSVHQSKSGAKENTFNEELTISDLPLKLPPKPSIVQHPYPWRASTQRKMVFSAPPADFS